MIATLCTMSLWNTPAFFEAIFELLTIFDKEDKDESTTVADISVAVLRI